MLLELLFTLILFQDQPIREEITVKMKQLKVRVQDPDGTPIKGLQQGDFLFERNGSAVKVELFQEVDFLPEPIEEADLEQHLPAEYAIEDLEKVPMPEMSRYVSVLMDSGMATPDGFNHLKENIRRLLVTLRPNDQVRLYEIHNQVRPLTGFTTDKLGVAQKLEELVYSPSLWSRMENAQFTINQAVERAMTPRMLPQVEARNANIISEPGPQVRNPATDTVKGELMGQMTIMNEGLKRKRRVKDAHALKVAGALEFVGSAMHSVAGDRAIFLFTTGGYLDDANSSQLKQVTSRLNWDNISVNAFHLRDRDSAELIMSRGAKFSETDLQQWQNEMQRNGFVAQGNGNNNLWENDSELKGQPRSYAGETGGTFVSAFNELQAIRQMKTLAQASAHYYLISYKPDGSLEKMNIRLRQPREDAVLIYGKTRGIFNTFGTLTKQEKLRDFANTLLYGAPRQETPVTWHFQDFAPMDGVHVFPVLGHLVGAFPEGGYEVGFTALDESGQVLDERKTEIMKPNQDGSLSFYDLLVVNTRPAKVRAIIREMETGKTTLSEFLPPELKSGRPNLSSIAMISTQQSQLYALHVLQGDKVKIDKKKRARAEFDPFILGENQMISFNGGPFPPGRPIGLFFKVQNLRDDLGNYSFQSYLKSNEQTVALPFKIAQVVPRQDGVLIMATLDASRLGEGTYEMGIALQDKRSGERLPFSSQSFTIGESSSSQF